MIQEGLQIGQKLSAADGVAQLDFQLGQDFRIRAAHANGLPAAFKFPVKIQRLLCKVAVQICRFCFGHYGRWLHRCRNRLRQRYIHSRGQGLQRMCQTEHGIGAIPVCLHRLQPCFTAFIVPVLLRCAFPQGQHHGLVDLFHTGRVGKLSGHLLNALPIIRNIVRAIRSWIQFRRTGKKVMNTPGKLPDFIISHSTAIFFQKEPVLCNQNTDPFGDPAPVQFHLRIGFGDAAVTE